jgi:hypothetical protein
MFHLLKPLEKINLLKRVEAWKNYTNFWLD